MPSHLSYLLPSHPPLTSSLPSHPFPPPSPSLHLSLSLHPCSLSPPPQPTPSLPQYWLPHEEPRTLRRMNQKTHIAQSFDELPHLTVYDGRKIPIFKSPAGEGMIAEVAHQQQTYREKAQVRRDE